VTKYKLKKKVLLGLTLTIIFAVASIIIGNVYARYTSSIDLGYTTTTGDMICDVEVDTSDTYYENNVAYFYVKVRNYKDNKITASNVDYVLTISNINESEGLYYYVDSKGNNNTDYESTITTDTYSFGTTMEEEVFKVYVKELSSEEVTVEFNVNVEAVQKDMEG